MAIRYDKQLSREIARTVRNFNAKVRRLEKIRRELVPERVSVASLKEEFTSRADLKRRLRELRGFSTRGAERIITTSGGVEITRYEYNILKQRAKVAKIRLSRQITELGKIEPAVYGKKQAHKYAEMGSEELSNLKARRKALDIDKPIKKLTRAEMKKYKKLVWEEYTKYNNKRSWQWRQNYMDIIDKVAYMCGVPIEQVQHIKDVLNNMPLTEFIQMINIERAFSKILDYYLLQKIQAGVLSYDDEAEVRDIFTSLDKNIEKIANSYNAYVYNA